MDVSNTNESELEALDQSMALNRVTMQLLKDRAQDCKRLWIALIVSILINLVIVGLFLWDNSRWEETTTETITTVEQDTGEGSGNNIYQSGENASYNQEVPKEANLDGSAEGDS